MHSAGTDIYSAGNDVLARWGAPCYLIFVSRSPDGATATREAGAEQLGAPLARDAKREGWPERALGCLETAQGVMWQRCGVASALFCKRFCRAVRRQAR